MKVEIEYRNYRASVYCSLGPAPERPGPIDVDTPGEFLSFYMNNQWRKFNINLLHALRDGRLIEGLKREIDKEIDNINKMKAARWEAQAHAGEHPSWW